MSLFPAIRLEGGLLSGDILEQLREDRPTLPGQQPRDFGLAGKRSILQEIAAIFSEATAQWELFRRRHERLSEDQSDTSITRDAWLIPFFSLLNYDLHRNSKAYEIDGLSFAISHRAGESAEAPPVHLVGGRQDLGRVAPHGRPRLSPHALVQQFLNHTEHLWGLVTNGRTLRLLRDCSYIRRQAYIEFDLQKIFEEQLFQDFVVLYRLLHRTRLPNTCADAHDCWLEKYYQLSLEQGSRVRDRLRDGVELCIQHLANGFLRHPANKELRQRLACGQAVLARPNVPPQESPAPSGALSSEAPSEEDVQPLSAQELYAELLQLVYRFLFLLVCEDRGLLGHDPLYREHYGISRFRRLVDRRSAYTDDHDLWLGLCLLWKLLSDSRPQPHLDGQPLASLLGLPVLDGQLFSPVLFDCWRISNRDLLTALWHLIYYTDKSTHQVQRVNYAALDVEELGSVYESLLDNHPVIVEESTGLAFRFSEGTERKSTGSYYTPPELVQELIKSALEPVIEERLAQAKRMAEEVKRVASGEWPVVIDTIRKLIGGTHAHTVLSRLGSLAKNHGFSRTHLSHDQGPSQGRVTRHDEPDAPGGGFHSSEHRRGMETPRDEGVSSVSQHYGGKPARVGDVSASSAASQAGSGKGGPSGPNDDRGSRSATGGSPTGPQAEVEAFWSALPLATRYSLLAQSFAQAAILSIRVLDPACGSGHFLLAAARRLGKELARVRAGEEEPSPEALREATREVIAHCIYGVDKNPLAVELCKVALWLESHVPGKPLTFLDHRIRCGDSLVGIWDPAILKKGIPDGAYDPVAGDDKAFAKLLKKRNEAERAGQLEIPFQALDDKLRSSALELSDLDTISDDSVEAIAEKQRRFNTIQHSLSAIRQAADLWTAAFFQRMASGEWRMEKAITTRVVLDQLEGRAHSQALAEAQALAQRLRFFHWPLEFPEVFLPSPGGNGSANPGTDFPSSSGTGIVPMVNTDEDAVNAGTDFPSSSGTGIVPMVNTDEDAVNAGTDFPSSSGTGIVPMVNTDEDAVNAGTDFPSPLGRGGRGEGTPTERFTHPHQPLPPDLVAFARQLRRKQTDAEKLLWSLLRNRQFGGWKFRRQHPVPPYVLDFFCHELQLAIELDGGQHNSAEARRYDEQRTKFLADKGIKVLRFWNHEVLRDTEAVLEAIWQEAMKRGKMPSPPAPLPEGEGVSSPPAPLPEGEGVSSPPAPLPEGEGGKGGEGQERSGSGFDVVLCNPPWERIKLQEEEFFATRDANIARAPNKAERGRRIKALQTSNPALWQEYQNALHDADALSKFLRASGRFPLTARGDINTYSVFAELFARLLRPEGRAGVVVPTGIATDATNQRFFAHLVQSGRLVSLYDFENREGLFPAVDSRYKFSLLTLRGPTASSERPVASSGEEEGQSQLATGDSPSPPFAVRYPPAQFAFFLTRADHIRDPQRRFALTAEDFALLNPNTRTCPIFRTRQDAELTKAIYRRVPVLVREASSEQRVAGSGGEGQSQLGTSESPSSPFAVRYSPSNPWGVRFLRMFDMANDSHLFRTRKELEREGFRLMGNVFVLPSRSGRGVGDEGQRYLPLYEAKMIWHYDHRFGTYEGVSSRSSTHLPTPDEAQHADPCFVALPWYWVPAEEVEKRLSGWNHGWLLGWRDIARSTDERTAVFSLLPWVGVGNKIPLAVFEHGLASQLAAFLGDACSIPFDFAARQKLGGTTMNFFYVKQFPVLPPSAYTPEDLLFIVPRVLELVYTAWDMKPFADDVWADADAALRDAIRRQWQENQATTGGVDPTPPEWLPLLSLANSESRIANEREARIDHSPLAVSRSPREAIPLPPFKWDAARRASLRAELDAYYARLYGLSRKQLRYILDPADLTERELADILDPWEEVTDPLDPKGYAERTAKSTFPGETFRVLKEKEIRQFGEYRTRRLVLEAWQWLHEGKVI